MTAPNPEHLAAVRKAFSGDAADVAWAAMNDQWECELIQNATDDEN